MGPRRALLLEPTLEPSPPLIPALIPVLIPALIPVLMPSLIGTAAGREYSLPYTPQLAQCNDPSTEFYDEELNKCCSQCPPAKTTKHYDCKRPAKETPCPSELEFSYKVDWAGAYQEVVSELVSSKGLTQAHHSGTCLTLAVKHLHVFTTKPCFCKGQYRTGSCSHTVDTKCSPCRPKTYTAIWNHSPQCFACSPPCRKGLVQNQTCTRSQDRICSCPAHKYCISKLDEYCEMCRTHKKCGKGYWVSRRGTDSTDTECEPCPPGTFSPEESYSTSCTPHTICKSVAVPGNSRNDTVCSGSGTATVLPRTILNLLVTQSPASHKAEIITQPVMLNSVPDLSHITGAVAGPLFLILIIGILGYCLVSKKKALVYSAAATEADLPFSRPEKQCDKKVRDTELQNSRNSEQEQQHLLETSGSSSSILNPTGSATISVISKENYENKNSGGFQQQHSPPEGSQFLSGDRHSSMSSEHSGNAGTQVNVTCIVKLCRPDCSSQCPEQRSSTSRDCGHTPWGSPAGEETFLSKEENALNKETEIHIAVENEDNLLQDLLPEEKKVPLGIQDAGMKTS